MKTTLFWSKYNPDQHQTIKQWQNQEVVLSSFHKLALLSHLKFGNEVLLHTYQKITNVPKGVVILNASDYYCPQEAFDALSRGHSIAHISDLVRIKSAIQQGALVCDMDGIVLRKLPETKQSFFTSLPAKKTGGVAPKWGDSNPAMTVHDGSWDGKALSNFPVCIFEDTAPHFVGLCDNIEEVLSKNPKKNSKSWNFIMWELKNILKESNHAKAYEPLYFGPIPGWGKPGFCFSTQSPTRLDGVTTSFGHVLPSIQEIMSKTYIVQHFFESASQSAPEKRDDLWTYLSDDALLAHEAHHILGSNWRNKLITDKKQDSFALQF